MRERRKEKKKKGKLRCQIKFLSHNFHEASQLSTPFRKWMPSVQFLHVSKSWGGKKNKRREEDVTKIGRVFQAKDGHLEKYFIFHLPK